MRFPDHWETPRFLDSYLLGREKFYDQIITPDATRIMVIRVLRFVVRKYWVG